MNRLLIVDIDGVLADCSHRLHFQKEKDYNSFYSANNMLKDELIESGKNLIRTLSYVEPLNIDRCTTILLTGRPEPTREVTEAWLKLKGIFPSPEAIIMRRDKDYRPSDIVKAYGLVKYLFDKKSEGMESGQVEKLKNLLAPEFLTRLLEDYDEVIYVDDDPKNVKGICALIPRVTGLVFGTGRL